MRSTNAIFALMLFLALPAARQTAPAKSPATVQSDSKTAPAAQRVVHIDGIAARIGNDVVTDSEVGQLQDFQRLIDGQSQSRAAVVQELVDQWIVRTEATTTKFPRPAPAEVAEQLQALISRFPSAQQFEEQLAKVGLTRDEVRQVLEKQLYYARFLNYKFHAAAQVTSAQIEAYYEKDLAPQLEQKGQAVPPLNQVEAQIRLLLTQQEINRKAEQWLQEAKARLRIVIQPSGGGG